MTTRELTAKSPSGRVKRTPLNQRNRLSIKDRDPNYHYRIVNTTDGHGFDRINDFLEAGYEVVSTSVGDKRVDQSAGLGSAPEFSVGQGTKAVVMRIKKEWYEEDMAAQQAVINAQEETMRRDARQKADYGSGVTIEK